MIKTKQVCNTCKNNIWLINECEMSMDLEKKLEIKVAYRCGCTKESQGISGKMFFTFNGHI